MADGDLIGRVVLLDSSKDNRGNFHNYVAIAYSPSTDKYLLVNFTTPIGNGNPFSIKIAKCEFPAILKHESEIEFKYPKEMSAADLRAKHKKSPNGMPYVCPGAVVLKIRNKIISGTEMSRDKSQAYGL